MSEKITKDQVFEKLKKVILDTCLIEEVTEETTLDDDMNMDSLDVISLVMACEKEFDIDIPDAECSGLNTVGQLLDIVCAKLSI